MRIRGSTNVFDAALDRIRWIYSEFPNVVCSVSGGKDSTVIFNLALIVARETNRLPLKCMFLDQEAEWQSTIDHMREIMGHPDVEPIWLQVPFRLFNATSADEHWLHCWDPEKESMWMREKEACSLKENIYGVDRFHLMFPAISKAHFPDTKTCYLAGMRVEESPARAVGLTATPTYKWVTWGKILDKQRQHYTMYPIYDWRYSDIWKAINDNGWSYSRLYDQLYSYGVPAMKMRVSNVHHETAVQCLFHIQEIEPETYARLTSRIAGIDMAAKMGVDNYFVHELPFMFSGWGEYRDYLLLHLIKDEKWKEGFRTMFRRQEKLYGNTHVAKTMRIVQVQSILTNDWEGIKTSNWERLREPYEIRRGLRHAKP